MFRYNDKRWKEKKIERSSEVNGSGWGSLTKKQTYWVGGSEALKCVRIISK